MSGKSSESGLDTARQCADVMFDADTASQMLGIEINIPSPGRAVATMQIRDDMVNGFDVCHGGIIFSLADTAFAFACNAYNRLSVAASASIEFLKPVHRGDRLTATATEEHRGKRNGLYSVDVINQHGDRVALFRGRSASRDQALVDPPPEIM